jgi:hypothetical protein
MPRMKHGLMAVGILSLALYGCNEDDEPAPIPEMPRYFWLEATASGESAEFNVECRLEFIVEISGEVSRTDEVVEYTAIMGGEAARQLLRDDGSGVAFVADAYYPDHQVLHILPDRVQIVSPDFSPDEPTSGSRFWHELRFFEGTIDRNGVMTGEWLCAPLDTDRGDINDNSVFAEGTWVTTEITE